jgi:hypothetical protein
VAALAAVAGTLVAGCLLADPRDVARSRTTNDEPDLIFEGRFASEIADMPCDWLTATMVAEVSGVEAEYLRRYELGTTCAYVWDSNGQAALRNVTILETVEEAEAGHFATRALDDYDSIDDVGDDACMRVQIGEGDGEAVSISLAVRVSNMRFSVVWVGSDHLMDRLRAVELARRVIHALPDDEPVELPEVATDQMDAIPVAAVRSGTTVLASSH